MSQSIGKTLLFLLLIIVSIFLIFKIVPAIFVFSLLLPGIQMGIEKWIVIIPLLFVLISWILITIWVYCDAKRRAMNGILWSLLVFLGNIIGLIIYLIVRSEQLSQGITGNGLEPCPGCRKTVRSTFSFCPYCGARLKAVCGSCKKPVASDWQVCPYCGQRQNEEQR